MLCLSSSVNIDMLKIMLNTKDATEEKNKHGRNLLHSLCTNSAVDVDLMRYLHEKNRDAAKEGTKEGWTTLHYLCNNSFATLDTIKYLGEAR